MKAGLYVYRSTRVIYLDVLPVIRDGGLTFRLASPGLECHTGEFPLHRRSARAEGLKAWISVWSGFWRPSAALLVSNLIQLVSNWFRQASTVITFSSGQDPSISSHQAPIKLLLIWDIELYSTVKSNEFDR